MMRITLLRASRRGERIRHSTNDRSSAACLLVSVEDLQWVG